MYIAAMVDARQIALACQMAVAASVILPYVGYVGTGVRAAASVAKVASLASSTYGATKQAIEMRKRRQWLRRMQAEAVKSESERR
jgi:hypothetical protein